MSGLLAQSVARVARQGARPQPLRAFSTNRMNPVYPSPWNKWFPHEPIPSTAQIGPHRLKLMEKEVYYYCTCGESSTAPWCESVGSKCGKMPEFVPTPFIPRYNSTFTICGCNKAPDVECNGACVSLYADLNILPACAMGFGGCFAFSVFYTWMSHP
mmetsp:Transcript_119454/g.254915  ORF Transcript_119454/g.254915 Transcript_119454/m.254915 type:complete len:157 (+) Transcript_119454:55-525(+)